MIVASLWRAHCAQCVITSALVCADAAPAPRGILVTVWRRAASVGQVTGRGLILFRIQLVHLGLTNLRLFVWLIN